MVIQHSNDCKMEYKKYNNRIIPIFIVDRKKRYYSASEICHNAGYYSDNHQRFMESKRLVLGTDYVKISDAEITRLQGIRNQDGYGKIIIGKIWFTESGLTTYLLSIWDKKQGDENEFAKWCDENLLPKKIVLEEISKPNNIVQPCVIGECVKDNNATIWKCISDLDGLYVDFKNIITASDKIKEPMIQLKGFLIAMKQDSNFVDEFTYSLESFCKAFKQLDTISSNLKMCTEDNNKHKLFINNVIQKSLKDLLDKIKEV
jgi:hypothetical protein